MDENPSKIESVFRGKKLIPPKDLSDNHHTLLTYGESGLKIKERFVILY